MCVKSVSLHFGYGHSLPKDALKAVAGPKRDFNNEKRI